MLVNQTQLHSHDGPVRGIFPILVPCFVLTVVLGLLSDGVYHDDDLTHFLMARWAAHFSEYLIHVWARPGLTLPLALVAWIGEDDVGWHAARILSALVTGATALLAARVAAQAGVRNVWLVVLACYLQPLNVVLACTTLTENFAAFYLISAVALLNGSRPRAASAVFSLTLLTRHEALGFLPIWWLAVLDRRAGPRRKAVACLVALWAPAAHNVIFRVIFGAWPVGIFFRPHGSTEYPAVGPLAYLPQALHAVPPVIAGLALVGAIAFLRRGRLLIPALAGLFIVIHVAIKALGIFASGGYGRFMVTVAPMVAILAAAGFNAMAGQLRRRRLDAAQWLAFGAVWPIGLAAFDIERRAGRIAVVDARLVWSLYAAVGIVVLLIAACWVRSRGRPGPMLRRITVAVLVLTCAGQWVCTVRPLRLRGDHRRVREVVGWLRGQALDDAPFFAANPWFARFLGLIEHPRAHKDGRLLASMPVGTVFIWDSLYSDNDYHGLTLESFQRDRCYELLKAFPPPKAGMVEMFAFRKIGETPVPRDAPATYPPDLISGGEPFLGIYYIRPARGRGGD